MRVSDLQEMDIVLLRSGEVCWILMNDSGEGLEVFGKELWGRHYLSNYYEDFAYGVEEKVRCMSRSERARYVRNDIVAVCKPRSKWQAMNLMRVYESALKDKDEEYLKECFDAFDWVFVRK